MTPVVSVTVVVRNPGHHVWFREVLWILLDEFYFRKRISETLG